MSGVGGQRTGDSGQWSGRNKKIRRWEGTGDGGQSAWGMGQRGLQIVRSGSGNSGHIEMQLFFRDSKNYGTLMLLKDLERSAMDNLTDRIVQICQPLFTQKLGVDRDDCIAYIDCIS